MKSSVSSFQKRHIKIGNWREDDRWERNGTGCSLLEESLHKGLIGSQTKCFMGHVFSACIFFGSDRSPRSHFVRLSVCPVTSCLEQLIFIFLGQRAIREQSSTQRALLEHSGNLLRRDFLDKSDTSESMASKWHFPNFQLSKIHNILNFLLSESCKFFYFPAFWKLIFVFQLSGSRDSFHFHAFQKVWKWKAES